MTDLQCEALATKAELQELRDQLNEVLGQKEDGESVQLFEAGLSQGELNTLYALTAIGVAAKNFPEAVTDIVTSTGGAISNWKDLASGRAKLLLKKGKGAVKESSVLNKFTKASGNGIGGGNLAAKGGGSGGAGLAVLSSLVQLAANLALNIATVNVLDGRIEAESRGAQIQIDAVNSSMLRLYDKQQGNIDAVINVLNQNQAVANQNKVQIEQATFEIQEANLINTQLLSELSGASQAIAEGRARYDQLIAQLNNPDAQQLEVIDDLQTQAEGFKTQLDAAEVIIEQQESTITSLTERITTLEEKATNLVTRIEQLELQSGALKEEFEALKIELQGDLDITNDRVTLLEGKIVKVQRFVKLNQGGSSSASAATGAADSQTGILKLANNLAGNPIQVPTMTNSDVYNGSQRFKQLLEDLLPQIDTSTMTPEQLESFRRDIGEDFGVKLDDLATIALIPRLDDLQRQTSPSALRNATEAGICNSLNGGSCPATPGNPNPTQGLGGLKDFLSGKMDAINAFLNGTAITQNQAILGIVRNTNDAVRNTKFGLEAAFNFAEKAWKFTRADKIIAVANLAASVHNAAHLSRNLGQTLGDVASSALQFAKIKAPDGSAIDVNEIIGNSIEGMLKNILGAENYENTKESWLNANRILTAGRGIISAVRGGKEAILEAHQVTGGWIAQIGNSVQDQGLIEDDSYRWMPPRPDFRTPFKGYLTKIDNLEEAASQVNSLVSSGIEFQENINEGIDATARLTKALDDFQEEAEADRETALSTNESPDIPNISLVKHQES